MDLQDFLTGFVDAQGMPSVVHRRGGRPGQAPPLADDVGKCRLARQPEPGSSE